MSLVSPTEVVRSLLWIYEAQNHVNSCVDSFHELEAYETACELQRLIDKEWNRLGAWVAGRSRPLSALRGER